MKACAVSLSVIDFIVFFFIDYNMLTDYSKT